MTTREELEKEIETLYLCEIESQRKEFKKMNFDEKNFRNIVERHIEESIYEHNPCTWVDVIEAKAKLEGYDLGRKEVLEECENLILKYYYRTDIGWLRSELLPELQKLNNAKTDLSEVDSK